MGASPFASFVGGYAKSQSPIANCATLQNAYVQALPSGSKSNGALYPTPGMLRFGQVGQVGGKRFFSTAASNSRVFSITGLRLYEWFFDGSAIERGTVASDANPATIYQNGKGGQQLAITAGGNFYCYDLLTNTLTQAAFLTGKGTQAGFIDGYFVVFDVNTGTVYDSDLYDGLTFDPANFFQRNTQADDWAASACSARRRATTTRTSAPSRFHLRPPMPACSRKGSRPPSASPRPARTCAGWEPRASPAGIRSTRPRGIARRWCRPKRSIRRCPRPRSRRLRTPPARRTPIRATTSIY
jgi:hypothetical protein